MEPDTDRVVLLAQIALEGVNLSAEVQAVASDGVLEGILTSAKHRNKHRLPPMRYVARSVAGRARVYPEFGALPLLDM